MVTNRIAERMALCDAFTPAHAIESVEGPADGDQ